jgi:hypothetical protein
LPKRFGCRHTVYMQINWWSRNDLLDRVFEKLQMEQIVRIKIEVFALDLASVRYIRTAREL